MGRVSVCQVDSMGLRPCWSVGLGTRVSSANLLVMVRWRRTRTGRPVTSTCRRVDRTPPKPSPCQSQPLMSRIGGAGARGTSRTDQLQRKNSISRHDFCYDSRGTFARDALNEIQPIEGESEGLDDFIKRVEDLVTAIGTAAAAPHDRINVTFTIDVVFASATLNEIAAGTAAE